MGGRTHGTRGRNHMRGRARSGGTVVAALQCRSGGPLGKNDDARRRRPPLRVDRRRNSTGRTERTARATRCFPARRAPLRTSHVQRRDTSPPSPHRMHSPLAGCGGSDVQVGTRLRDQARRRRFDLYPWVTDPPRRTFTRRAMILSTCGRGVVEVKLSDARSSEPLHIVQNAYDAPRPLDDREPRGPFGGV